MPNSPHRVGRISPGTIAVSAEVKLRIPTRRLPTRIIRMKVVILLAVEHIRLYNAAHEGPGGRPCGN
jgi:hypothetical protein